MQIFRKRKSNRLLDLIPNNYIDLHSHLLPAIDDGVSNAKDALALFSQLGDMGFTKFVITPHVMKGVWDNTTQSILHSLDIMYEYIAASGTNFTLHAAAEYLIDDNFLILVRSNDLLPLADNHVLVEFSFINFPLNFYEVIFEMRNHGYVPVIAHPERYRYLVSKPGEYRRLKELGCKFQLNLLSVTGYYGTTVCKIAQRLIESGMIDYTGSDIHNQMQLDAFHSEVLVRNSEFIVRLNEKNSALFL